MKTCTVYLHSDGYQMRMQGEELGLTGEALNAFSYSLYEIAIELEVDEDTGDVTIIHIDGVRFLPYK